MSRPPSPCLANTTPSTRISLAGRLGDALRRHQRLINRLQWTMVCLYLVLLLVPPALLLPASSARFYNNFRLFAQFLLWGIWWPGVILCTMLLGRVWCGVFCPEGALTEWASGHGRNRSIPRWMRWRGWPFATFAAVTLYGQLAGMFRHPQAALLILGSSTAAALAVGYTYGRQKRIWCRYLCPANAVFAPLAKTALLHFRVDPEPWKKHRGRLPPINCAPLIDIRHMKSTSACHACGRCSDYLDAVTLAVREPASEILSSQDKDISTAEALTLIFGVIGLATSACLWPGSPWHLMLESLARQWLSGHPALLSLLQPAPWWLLLPDLHAGAASTWLDGACLLIVMAGGGALLGMAILATVFFAARLVRLPQLSWQRLTLALIPLAGLNLFLGLSLQTLAQLKSAGIAVGWMPAVQIALLVAGNLFSALLGWKMIAPQRSVRRHAAALLFAMPLLLIDLLWISRFSA